VNGRGNFTGSSTAKKPCNVVQLISTVGKGEDNTNRITKIVLVVRFSEWVAVSGQQVVNFDRPKRYCLVDGDVNAAAEIHRESFGRGRLGKRAASSDRLAEGFEGVTVNIGVRSAEQKMSERLDLVGPDLHLRAKKVGEHVALHVAVQAARESRIRRDVETGCVARVTLQVHLETEIFIPVISQ